jgi:hypothetical protein
MTDHSSQPGVGDDAISDDDTLNHLSETETDDGSQGADDERKKALSRDELYARLGAVDDPDTAEPSADADQPDDEDADEADEDPDADDEAEEDDADAGEDDEAGPETPDAKADEEPQKIDEKLLGRVPDTEWKALPKVTRDRINALRVSHKKSAERIKDLESRDDLAKYAEHIIRFADENKIGDRDLQTWLEVGAVVQRGGDDAVKELLSMARAFGWSGEPLEDAAPLPDWLQAKVDSFEIDVETAAEIAKHLDPQTGQPPARPKAPRLGPDDEALARGKQTIDAKLREAEKRFGGDSWAKLWPQVQRRMLLQKGAHPDAWASIFDSAVEAAVAENKQKPARVGRTGLAPAGRGGSAQPDPDKLKGRERLYAMYSGRGKK